MMRQRWLVWSFFVAAWTTLLLMPAGATETLAALNDFIQVWKYYIAKTLHVLGYVVMAVLTGWLHAPMRWRAPLMFVLMAHAGVTEMVQTLVGRGGRLTDVGLDHLGILIGFALTWKQWSGDEDRDHGR